MQNQNSIKNKLIRVQQESITSLANIEDISNKLLKKIEGLVAVNNKNLYYSTNEAYMLKHAFKNFSIADERIYTMLQDLDLQSAENLWRIITRIERAKHSEGMHIDLFTQEEKKKLTSLDENLHGAIIQLAPDIYSYKNKLLPIKDFEVGVFDYFHGIFELSPHLIEQIKNGVILDVGAYIGDSALALSGVFPNAHILSFEAIPNNVLLANKTIEMNNLTNVELIPTALADRQGNSFIFSNGIGSSLVTTECEGSIEIPIDTLDNVVRKKQLTRINVIKVDIEGGEQAFLRGAKETIEKYRPVLLISIYHSWNDFMQIKPLIDSWNLNYRFKIVRPVDGYIFIDTLLICEPQ